MSSTTPLDFEKLKNPPPALIQLVAKQAVAYQQEQAETGQEIQTWMAVQHVLESDPEVAQAVEQARQAQPLLDDRQIGEQAHDQLAAAEAKRQAQALGKRIGNYQEVMKRVGVYVDTGRALHHIQAADRGEGLSYPEGIDPQALATVAASYQEQQARQGREITITEAINQLLRGDVD